MQRCTASIFKLLGIWNATSGHYLSVECPAKYQGTPQREGNRTWERLFVVKACSVWPEVECEVRPLLDSWCTTWGVTPFRIAEPHVLISVTVVLSWCQNIGIGFLVHRKKKKCKYYLIYKFICAKLPKPAYVQILLMFAPFANLRITIVGFVVFVCQSVRPHGTAPPPTGRISVKFDIWLFFRNSVEKIEVPLKSDKNNRYSAWRSVYIFDHISLISY